MITIPTIHEACRIELMKPEKYRDGLRCQLCINHNQRTHPEPEHGKRSFPLKVWLRDGQVKAVCNTCGEIPDFVERIGLKSQDSSVATPSVAPTASPASPMVPPQVELVEPEIATGREPGSDDEPVIKTKAKTTKREIDPSPRVEFKNGAMCEPESIEWFWFGWLARRKFHLVAGEPGTNKTTIAIALGATMTIAGRWPDGSYCDNAKNVVMWSSEDDFEDTILPRFIANGGDRSKFYFIHRVTHKGNVRSFNPKKDLPLLTQRIEEIGNVGLVIIDSIADCTTGDSHNNSDTRNSLQPLVDAANKYNFAALGVAHFNKGNESNNPLSRIVGSIAFGGMARLVFASALDPDEPVNQRLLVRVKSNIGMNHGGFRYAVKLDSLPNYKHIQAAHIEWMDELHGTAKELLGVDMFGNEDKPNKQGRIEEAKEFLIKILSNVDMLRLDEVERLGKENDFTINTLNKAKQQSSNVVSLKGTTCWYWKMKKE